MAEICELNQTAWAAWLKTRPPIVQAMCERLPPNKLYRMKSSGQRVTLYSYSEDGTVTVNVSGEYNLTTFDRRVFGIDPDDLEECELPTKDELLGTVLTDPAAVDAFIDEVRPAILAARDADNGTG